MEIFFFVNVKSVITYNDNNALMLFVIILN